MAKELTVKMISENELDNKLNDVFVKSVNTVNAGLVAKGGVIDNLTQGQTNIISTMNVIKNTADNSKKIADTAYQNSVGAIDSLKNKADISHKHNLADINDLDISKYSTKDEVKTSVDDAIKKLVGSAPDTLNTLQKIAQELQDPSNNTASTVLDQIANKADASALTDEVIRAKAAEKANADEIAKKANSTDVYTKIEIDNKGYLTEHQSLDEYAKKTDLDSYQPKGEYLTSIPEEYVTETELESKKYLTEHQSLDEYAKKIDLSTLATKEEITEIKKWMRTIVESLAGNKESTAKLYDASNGITSEFNAFAPAETTNSSSN